MIHPRPALLLLVLAGGPMLAGCQNSEPYRRTDVWQPTGANAGNIQAMLVRPADIIRGRGVARTDAHGAADAVAHVWQGRARPLPNPSSTTQQSAPPLAAGAPN